MGKRTNKEAFIGDGLLGFLVKEILYDEYPILSLGDMNFLSGHFLSNFYITQMAYRTIPFFKRKFDKAQRFPKGTDVEVLVYKVYTRYGLNLTRKFVRKRLMNHEHIMILLPQKYEGNSEQQIQALFK